MLLKSKSAPSFEINVLVPVMKIYHVNLIMEKL